MSLRQYLIVIGIGTLIGFATWLVVLVTVNPFQSGFVGFLFFYLSLAITLVGLMSLVGFGVRMLRYQHDEIVLREATAAFRQSCFFSIVVVTSVFLASQKLLTWWGMTLLIAALAIIELLIASMKWSRRQS